MVCTAQTAAEPLRLLLSEGNPTRQPLPGQTVRNENLQHFYRGLEGEKTSQTSGLVKTSQWDHHRIVQCVHRIW